MKKVLSFPLLCLISLSLAFVSCTPPLARSPNPTAAIEASVTSLATEKIETSILLSPTPTATVFAPTIVPSPTYTAASAQGPWLVGASLLSGQDKSVLFLADVADRGLSHTPLGSAKAKITSNGLALSPDGSMIAVRWHTGDNDYGLSIYSIPNLVLVMEISLIGNEASNLLASLEDQRPPIKNALDAAPGSILWSPNSRYLAFVGAMDTDSTDVYVFDTTKNEVRHLTSGATQSYLLAWSPDSQWIIHASYDDVGIGIGIKAIWAVSASKGTISFLYSAEPYVMDVNILGWLNEQTFLAQSKFFEACAGDVKEVSISSGVTATILSARNSGADFDPVNRRMLFVKQPGENYCGSSEPGIYSIDPKSGNISVVVQGDYYWFYYIPELGAFTTRDSASDAMKVITSGGRIILDLPGATEILPSPSGKLISVEYPDHLAIYSNEGSLIAQVRPIVCGSLRWLPNDEGIVIFPCSNLSTQWDIYLASAGWEKTATMQIPFRTSPDDFLLIGLK